MKARIVIVGGGFGGLEAVFSLKALLSRTCDITLIDRSAYHSFIPSIHLIISGKASVESLRIPLKTVLNAAGITFIQNEVVSIDIERKEVITRSNALPYDYLLLSAGATNNFFDIPGAEDFSCRFRTPEDAERIRIELVKMLDNGTKPCRVVLAGAGTEGVEVIGEVLDLIRAEGREEEMESGRITIELIEGRSSLLPGFPLKVQNRVADYLRHQGVIVTAGERIAEVRKDEVLLTSGRTHQASILIWSGGIQPSKLIRDLPLSKDPWGWLKVTDRLSVYGDEHIYGIGDTVSIYTDDGPLALQRLAYHAQDQARAAALNIFSHIEGKTRSRYEPKNRPQLISLGRNMGIFTFEDQVRSGPWVVSLKKAVER
jgi:NADH dehydrogenase